MAHIYVRIADVKNREAVEQRRHICAFDIIVFHGNARGVLAPAPIEPGQLQNVSYQRMNGVPVLDMKEVEALAEDLGFMISFDSKPLPRVDPP